MKYFAVFKAIPFFLILAFLNFSQDVSWSGKYFKLVHQKNGTLHHQVDLIPLKIIKKQKAQGGNVNDLFNFFHFTCNELNKSFYSQFYFLSYHNLSPQHSSLKDRAPPA